MKLLQSVFSQLAASIYKQRKTLTVWAVIIIAVTTFISVNQSQHAAVIAKLSSPNQTVRDNEVLVLSRNGQLLSYLLSTEDASGDDTSPQNVKSAKITADAVDSVLRILPKLNRQQAFAVLYSLQKDSSLQKDKVSAANSITGLSELGEISYRNLWKLAQGLGDPDPDKRSAAVSALGQIGGAEAAALAYHMYVKANGAQDSALSALTKIGKPAIPYVIEILQSSNYDESLKEEAASALGDIGDPSAARVLEAESTTSPPSPELRRVCLTALSQIMFNTLQPFDVATSSSSSPPDPIAIAEARAEGPFLVASLLNQNDDSFARAREALALGQLATPLSVSALVQTLGSLDSRLAAASQAGIETAGASAIPDLAQAVHSNNVNVRMQAASALGVIGTSAALVADEDALSDPSPLVRKSAVDGIGRSNNPAAVPLLIEHMGDPDGAVASAVSNSLHELGAPAIGPLIGVLAKGGSDVPEPLYASEALRADGPVVMPQLIAASSTAGSEQKIWIAVTMGAIGDPTAISTLKRLAADTNVSVRWAASQALDECQGEG